MHRKIIFRLFLLFLFKEEVLLSLLHLPHMAGSILTMRKEGTSLMTDRFSLTTKT